VERLRRWHRVEERDRTEKREIGGREMWWERERSMRKFMAARVHDLEKVSGSWSGENGGKKKQRGRDRRGDHFIYGTEVVQEEERIIGKKLSLSVAHLEVELDG
jgi:hypothetical protein